MVRSAKIRPRQDQLADEVGPRDGEFLRNESAHRVTHHRRAREPERIHQPRRIFAEHFRRIRTIGLVGVARAAIVERDHAKFLREAGNHAVPHPQTIAHPRDQDERLARAKFLVIDLDAVAFNVWHRCWSQLANARGIRGVCSFRLLGQKT